MKSLINTCTRLLMGCFLLINFSQLNAEIKTNMEVKNKMEIRKDNFGKTSEGIPVEIFTLTNNKGMMIKIETYGGAICEIWVPDNKGKFEDVALGYNTIEGYEKGNSYLGPLVGRYANRIGKAQFSIDGVEYKLPVNDNGNQLHGGLKGLHRRVWTAEPITNKNSVAVKLTYFSKDGEEGYPGNMNIAVTYTLNDNNEIEINYFATTDKKTVINLTNHAYFNLAGVGNGDILNHVLKINADQFTPVDETLIPHGELRKVEGTPMDFRKPTTIGSRINDDYEQLKLGSGYDHNWVINRTNDSIVLAAEAYEPVSGRVLQVLTTEPGIQFYSGNFLNGSEIGKKSIVYNHRFGFCLETQHFPNSPNVPEFPSVILEPGKEFHSTTIYKFLTK
jgi:aldose 1-epimerase